MEETMVGSTISPNNIMEIAGEDKMDREHELTGGLK